MTRDKEYAYWLCSLPGIGNRAIERLLTACGGSPEQVYHASEKIWESVLNAKQYERMKVLTNEWDLQERYLKMEQQGICFLWKDEVAYPERLRHIPDAPYGIFYKGRLPDEEVPSVAVIGARDCSQYGGYVATEIGKYLGEKGVQIISGMARGIDGISQGAALAAGGASFGVLGCGVDICYPTQNRKLYEELIRCGGVISTHPPGTEARPQHFPPRNRIVSGFADAVVVVEARQKSGTLITVDMALEQGKEVYVVPGRITDRLSDGCNSLLKQGAGVFLSPQEFCEEIMDVWREHHGIQKPNGPEEKREIREAVAPGKSRGLSEELEMIYGVLDWYPQSVEQIISKLPGSYSHIQVNTCLLRLCMEQVAVQLSPGYFCRK